MACLSSDIYKLQHVLRHPLPLVHVVLQASVCVQSPPSPSPSRHHNPIKALQRLTSVHVSLCSD
jgi:hypothetical protein